MEVKGKKVLVFGLGISGIGAGKILERQGAEVVLYDGNKKLMEEKVRQQSGADSNEKIIIGECPLPAVPVPAPCFSSPEAGWFPHYRVRTK